ncbi:hypothetical protein R1sor_011739 [Riccia sorocarpa]|uniref:Reverse transcriptase domain-containing protein n=1 Tax=Riccia sorocarpa TaxID=122646 RepID=A0ABD3I1R0_9MARC
MRSYLTASYTRQSYFAAKQSSKRNRRKKTVYCLKDFDTLRWDFLYEAMAKMDFGDEFILLVSTLNRNAASSVRINGSCSNTFQHNSRSVRQGCPLSPLLFTIAIQVFTDAINTMVQENQIKGVELHTTRLHYCQGFFADDAHLLLQADRQNLLNAKTLLHSFGTASGLKVQWGKSKARWISEDNPKPPWTQDLDWIWGTDNDVDKFVGFQFTDTLNPDAIFEAARRRVIEKINSPTNCSTTIHGRVTIANQIVYGIIWFILPLWAANKSMIRSIETIILRFVWGGNESTKRRHRVAESILHQKKKDGGLGLMSLQAHAQAFTAKLVRWAYIPGTHPLKEWLQANFNSIANLRWGSSHFTWISTPSKGVWPALSPLLLHICRMWQNTVKFLAPLQHLPLEPWKRLSLWGPKTTGVRNQARQAKTGPTQRLKQAGVEEIGQITADGRSALPLQQVALTTLQLNPHTHRAYARIIDSTPMHAASYRCNSQFAVTRMDDPRWCVWLTDNAPADWSRAPVATCWSSQKKAPDRFLFKWQDKETLLANLQWRDQTGFLAASNASIRSLVSSNTTKVELRLQKWVAAHHFNANTDSTWTKLWRKDKPIKHVILQWYILFQGIPTNTWRHPQTPRDQEPTWCVSCNSNAAEDIEHLFWKCQWVAGFWRWAVETMHIAFPETRRWDPRFKHAVLGADPPQYCKPASRWWERWRMTILWIIWTLRNEKIFRNVNLSMEKAKALAWHKLVSQTKKH